MANDVTQRVHYFDHQFLRVGEFDDEQQYHLDRRRRHNRLLHTPGVAGNPATDLFVTGTAGATTVNVSPGTAIDADGQDIVLAVQKTLALPSGPTKIEIYIAYSEAESDPTTD